MGHCRNPDAKGSNGSHRFDQLPKINQRDHKLSYATTTGTWWSVARHAPCPAFCLRVLVGTHWCPLVLVAHPMDVGIRSKSSPFSEQSSSDCCSFSLLHSQRVLVSALRDHLQARETSPGPIVSSTLHPSPRKVPISASCVGLLVTGLGRGLDPAPSLLFSLCGV